MWKKEGLPKPLTPVQVTNGTETKVGFHDGGKWIVHPLHANFEVIAWAELSKYGESPDISLQAMLRADYYDNLINHYATNRNCYWLNDDNEYNDHLSVRRMDDNEYHSPLGVIAIKSLILNSGEYEWNYNAIDVDDRDDLMADDAAGYYTIAGRETTLPVDILLNAGIPFLFKDGLFTCPTQDLLLEAAQIGDAGDMVEFIKNKIQRV